MSYDRVRLFCAQIQKELISNEAKFRSFFFMMPLLRSATAHRLKCFSEASFVSRKPCLFVFLWSSSHSTHLFQFVCSRPLIFTGWSRCTQGQQGGTDTEAESEPDLPGLVAPQLSCVSLRSHAAGAH